jgi:uncharacterized protein with HEPN domain
MKERSRKLFLCDIIESIEYIDKFIEGLTYDSFITDEKTKSAVVRKIEVMGEAAKNLSPEFTLKHKDIPWSLIARMRDKMIHGYFGVDYDMIWKTIHDDYPELKEKIKRLYDSLEA